MAYVTVFSWKDLEKYSFYNVDKKSLSMYLNNYILFSMVAIGYDIYEQKKLKRDVSIGFWDKRVKYYILFFAYIPFIAIIVFGFALLTIGKPII